MRRRGRLAGRSRILTVSFLKTRGFRVGLVFALILAAIGLTALSLANEQYLVRKIAAGDADAAARMRSRCWERVQPNTSGCLHRSPLCSSPWRRCSRVCGSSAFAGDGSGRCYAAPELQSSRWIGQRGKPTLSRCFFKFQQLRFRRKVITTIGMCSSPCL